MPEMEDAFGRAYELWYPLCDAVAARQWFRLGWFAREVAAQQLAEADRGGSAEEWLEKAEKVIRFVEGELGCMDRVGGVAWKYLADKFASSAPAA